MKTRIAWQVLATLPAAILAMQPTAEAADDEVVIGFAIAESGWMKPRPPESDTASRPSAVTSKLRPSLSTLTTVRRSPGHAGRSHHN
jgi:hypothetical protein